MKTRDQKAPIFPIAILLLLLLLYFGCQDKKDPFWNELDDLVEAD